MATPTINTYISDMLAVEQHIATPLQSQIDDADISKVPAAARVIREALSGVQSRISALDARLEAVGGHAGSPVKNAVSSLSGVAASAIDKVRKTNTSKSLRDDYTALCMASAGYTMLHTTALAMNDDATALLAKNHLADVATAVMRISSTLPVAVLSELQEEGVNVQSSVAATADQNAEEAWREGAARSATPV